MRHEVQQDARMIHDACIIGEVAECVQSVPYHTCIMNHT